MCGCIMWIFLGSWGLFWVIGCENSGFMGAVLGDIFSGFCWDFGCEFFWVQGGCFGWLVVKILGSWGLFWVIGCENSGFMGAVFGDIFSGFYWDFGCEISWVGWVLQRDSVGFLGVFFQGVSCGFLWLVFGVVFLFQKVLWEFFWLISYDIWLRIPCLVLCLQWGFNWIFLGSWGLFLVIYSVGFARILVVNFSGFMGAIFGDWLWIFLGS